MKNKLYNIDSSGNVHKADREDLENILKYVNENLDKNITLVDLYKVFYVNVQKIEKLFNKYLNVTYKRYVQNQRFELAKQYLVSTDLPLKQIAEKTGYSSIQSFSKFFKKISGISPMKFKKERN